MVTVKKGWRRILYRKTGTSGVFLSGLGLQGAGQENRKKGETATFHSPCHLRNPKDTGSLDRALIAQFSARFIPAVEENTCCGLGGTYSLRFPDISSQILQKKLEDFCNTGADTIVTECPGCILQLRGGIQRQGTTQQVKHLVEYLEDAGLDGED
jgi:Fe-S oxidoreductase